MTGSGTGETRWPFVMGILGPALFIGILLFEGATRPHYDPIKTFVSQLSLDGGGWIQIASFVVSGLFIGAFGLGLRDLVAIGRAPRRGWAAICLAGLGLIGAGVFVDDPWLGYPPGAPPGIDLPVSPHGWGHLLSALVAFVGLVGAPLIFARWFALQRHRLWFAYSVASATLFPALYVAALGSALAVGVPSGYAGLLQRASLVTALAWIALLAVQLLRHPPRADDPSSQATR